MLLSTFVHESPLGPLRLVRSEAALMGIYFEGHHPAPPERPSLPGEPAGFDEARRQLDAYFAGRRRSFELPLAPTGTPFQQAVWAELGRIPFGETRSYGQLARALGRPGAARAVGAANAHNPLSIVIPCHRIVGERGALTGYAGGEARKAWLLAHEGATALPLGPAPEGPGAHRLAAP